jgi:hypothetical protein
MDATTWPPQTGWTEPAVGLVAFLDESYSSDYYYIAAVVISEDEVARLEGGLARAAEYAEGFGVAAGSELHAHRIMSGRDDFAALRGRHRAASAIYARALHAIADSPVAIFIRGVDVTRLNARYRYPVPPHQIVLQHVLEDVSDHGKKLAQMVTVIADEVEDQDGHVQRVASFQVVGTPGYRSQTLPNLVMPIRFASSAATGGLQAVDLVVYLHRRCEDHQDASGREGRPDPDPRAVATADKLWNIIAGRVQRRWTWTP